MWAARILLPVLVALAAAGCARQQQTYVIDPSSGQPVPVVMQQQTAQPQYAQQSYQQPALQAAASGERGLFTSWQSAPQPPFTQPTYAQQPSQQPAPSSGRGLFSSPQSAPQAYLQQPTQQAYVQQPTQQTYVTQYGAPRDPQYATPRNGGPNLVPPNGFASASLY
jgi:hypothetical protein